MGNQPSNPGEESGKSSATDPQKIRVLPHAQAILTIHPDYVDVLRVLGNLLTLKGKYAEGLAIDKRLVRLRPSDALAHYNLACSYALLKRVDMSLKTLRTAMELGYSDFRYMKEDNDLESIRHDPRFRQMIREFENK
jgi:tetratricopeptide (TPR) repeat protein